MLAGLSAALAGRRAAADALTVTSTGTGAAGPGAGAGVRLRAPGTPSGLVNQGATCYLNSLLQVLLRLGVLRDALLAFDSGDAGDTCVARQLQVLAAQLELGAAASASTTALTRAFGWDSAEAFVQNDVHECLTVLLEAVAREAGGTPLGAAVAALLGSLEHYVTCSRCGRESTRVEAFTSLQVPVRGAATLEAALDAALTPELLDGANAYACDTCAAKTTARKGCRLTADGLPRVLCIHLSRFEYDFASMGRRKLSDRQQPVLTLDLSHRVATPQGADAPVFELVGVLLHVGSAHTGHYFSYTRLPSEAPAAACAEPRWVSFNDAVVADIPRAQLQRALGQQQQQQQQQQLPPAAAAPTNAAVDEEAREALTRVSLDSPSSTCTGTSSSSSSSAGGAVGGAASTPARPAPAAAPALRLPSTPAPAVVHDASTAAYMLVYVRRSELAAQLAPLDPARVPADLRAAIEVENAAVRAAAARWEAEQRRVRFCVAAHGFEPHPPPPPATAAGSLAALLPSSPTPSASSSLAVDVSVDVDAPVSELLRVCVAALAGGPGAATGDLRLWRLRLWDARTQQPLQPLLCSSGAELEQQLRLPVAQLPGAFLTSTGSSGSSDPPVGAALRARALCLEHRADAGVEWSDWHGPPCRVSVVLVRPQTGASADSHQLVPGGDAAASAAAATTPTATSAAAALAALAFAPAVWLSLPPPVTVGALRRAVAAHVQSQDGAPPGGVRLLVLPARADEAAVVLGDDEAPLIAGDRGASHLAPAAPTGATIHAELLLEPPSPSAPSRLEAAWDAHLHSVTLRVVVHARAAHGAAAAAAGDGVGGGSAPPPQQVQLVLDARATVGVLRQQLAALLAGPHPSAPGSSSAHLTEPAGAVFSLCRHPPTRHGDALVPAAGSELKDERATLAACQLEDGSPLHVLVGEPPTPPTHARVRVTLWQPPPALTALLPLGALQLPASALVSDLKLAALDAWGPSHLARVCGGLAARLWVREAPPGGGGAGGPTGALLGAAAAAAATPGSGAQRAPRPGRLLTDDRPLSGGHAARLADSHEFLLQALPQPEAPTVAGDGLLAVYRWLPVSAALEGPAELLLRAAASSAAAELPWARVMAAAGLQDACSASSAGGGAGAALASKPWTWQLGEFQSALWRVKWTPLSSLMRPPAVGSEAAAQAALPPLAAASALCLDAAASFSPATSVCGERDGAHGADCGGSGVRGGGALRVHTDAASPVASQAAAATPTLHSAATAPGWQLKPGDTVVLVTAGDLASPLAPGRPDETGLGLGGPPSGSGSSARRREEAFRILTPEQRLARERERAGPASPVGPLLQP